MSAEDEEQWALEELPGNLATLTCAHILEHNAEPTFVDYNGGYLTIFCERGEDHQEEAELRMICVSDFLERYQSLQEVRLVGGYSRAELDKFGRWHMSLQPARDEETSE